MLASPCPELTVIVINKFSQPYHISTALCRKISDIESKLKASHSSQSEPQNNTQYSMFLWHSSEELVVSNLHPIS